MSEQYRCRKFSYDPLKRVPRMPPPLPRLDPAGLDDDIQPSIFGLGADSPLTPEATPQSADTANREPGEAGGPASPDKASAADAGENADRVGQPEHL